MSDDSFNGVSALAARMGWREKWLSTAPGLMQEYWEAVDMQDHAEKLFHDWKAEEFFKLEVCK